MFDDDFKNFRLDRNERGTLTVAFDVPSRKVNVFDESVIIELERLVGILEGDSETAAVVFKSVKLSDFFAGADVATIVSLSTVEQAVAISARGQKLFDRIEHTIGQKYQPPLLTVIWTDRDLADQSTVGRLRFDIEQTASSTNRMSTNTSR